MSNPLSRVFARWRKDRRGSTATTFAVAAVGLLGVSGAAIDYSNVSEARAKIQSAADAAALAGAKEFRLGNANVQTVTNVAKNFGLSYLHSQGVTTGGLPATVNPTIDTVAKTVTVTIDVTRPMMLAQVVGIDQMQIRVSATAKVVGGAPICVVGLDTKEDSTILMDKSARLEAPGCSVFSNSTKNNGLAAKKDSVLKAAFICTAGGKYKDKAGAFQPEPQTDCPIIPDPLAARPQPIPSGCLQTNLVVSGGMMTLMPGTYCGGITIKGGANVTMASGTYIIKDGELKVTGGGSLTGNNVGIFLTGKNAVLNFDGPSTISLTAPKDGEMAGMLIFEDRAAEIGKTHEIMSDNARNLLGTIYLSRGRLHISAAKPVADQSAYTIVVARMFTLSEGPTMVLNSNYGATNIPVPAGVGPNANRTALIN